MTPPVPSERERRRTERAASVIDLPRWLGVLEQAAGELREADVRVVRAAERLQPFLASPGGRVQPVHGDAHPGNLIATRHGPVWIDFEEVSIAPVEWDLATVGDADAVAAHHQADPALLSRCGELRALQVALCLMALRDVLGDLDGWDEGISTTVLALG